MRITQLFLSALLVSCASCDRATPTQNADLEGSNVSSAQATADSQVVDSGDGLSPQTRPVFTWLKAVKDGDQEQLKTVFSHRMREQFDEIGWDKVLKIYEETFAMEFGDFELDAFTFEFDGESENGTVSISLGEKKLPGLRVIKEGGSWKVNER